MEWNLTNNLGLDILDNRREFTPRVRDKDDPYGLAPIRVTEAESKPSAGCNFARIIIKRGDIGFCPYEVSFCLARLPSVEGVLKSSGLTVLRCCKRDIPGGFCLPRQGEQPWLDGFRAVSNEGPILWVYWGQCPSFYFRRINEWQGSKESS